jgi:predicted dehydrogenase
MKPRLKFGIVGTGFIADVVADAIKQTETSLVAVASRRHENARAFADKHGGMQVFESWGDLVACDGLDAVYVATPTSVREEICIVAAQNKKHVLAEKPFASLTSLQKITQACKANRVSFMDATHFVHHPRTRQIKQELKERIGKVQAVYTSFFFPSLDRSNIRFNPEKEPTGAFGDMAWYSMRATIELATPNSSLVSGSGFVQRDEVSGACVRSAGALLLSDGCTSTWDVGYNIGTCVMDLNIYGQQGMISLDDFVLDWADGFAMNIPGYPVGFIPRSGILNPTGFKAITTPGHRPQVVNMIHNFVALAEDPGGQAAYASMRISEQTQGLLDAVWDQLIRI